MYRIIYIILLAVMGYMPVAAQSSATDRLRELLGGLGGSESADTTSASGGKGSSLGTSIGSILSNVAGSADVTPADMVGVWNYESPAVTFKSDNLLKKAGGAAAAAAVENKIAPYYRTAGLDKMVLTVNADSTFTMKLRRGSLAGRLKSGESKGMIVFEFKALKKIPAGSMEAQVVKSGNDVAITFDVTRLMQLVDRAASISGNSTLKGINSMLQGYDGLRAGFRLGKSR